MSVELIGIVAVGSGLGRADPDQQPWATVGHAAAGMRGLVGCGVPVW